MYGLLEINFGLRASREKGITGEALLVLLERRLGQRRLSAGLPVPAEGRLLVRGIFWLTGNESFRLMLFVLATKFLLRRTVGRWRLDGDGGRTASRCAGMGKSTGMHLVGGSN